MSTEENKAIVRRSYEDCVNRRNIAAMDDLYIADYRHHDPSLPPEVQHGLDNYKEHFDTFFSAFPDLQVTVEDLVAEGDKVACRWTWHGTHQGNLMGMPPTGKQVSVTAISIHRIAKGEIVEGWVNFDALGLMQQLGAIPTPEPAGV